mmetsp:Transcript_84992/g.147453  ORF Transcript_84992/g.147453 Transcript_84992/m.147453 type:complete len:276 (-) Transcript_84992:99-926(-)
MLSQTKACWHGRACTRPDCWFAHPEGRFADGPCGNLGPAWSTSNASTGSAALPPRQKNAQVIVMRQDQHGEIQILLQLRSYSMPVMPGYLAAIGGMRDRADLHSGQTAVREVVEEAGLLDVGHLDCAPKPFQQRAAASGALCPRAFCKFAQGAEVDWWALLLDGCGTFEPARDKWECADIRPLLRKLPGASLAPCFGHAWMPAADVRSIDASVPLMGGLVRRVFEAVLALRSTEKICDMGLPCTDQVSRAVTKKRKVTIARTSLPKADEEVIVLD